MKKIFALIFCSQVAFATSDPNVMVQLPSTWFVAPRTEALGGSITASADGFDALQTNPAGIGGLHWLGRSTDPLKEFYFPWLGVSGSALGVQRLKSQTNATTSTIPQGQAANARETTLFGGGYSRWALGAANTISAAGASIQPEDPTDTNNLLFHFQNVSGEFFGASVCDRSETLYLGVSAMSASVTDLQSRIDPSTMSGITKSSKFFSQNEKKYAGTRMNVGFIWVLQQRVSFGASILDLGNSKLAGPDGGLLYPQKINLGVSTRLISTQNSVLSWNFDQLGVNNPNQSIVKKIASSLEWNVGSGFGRFAGLGLMAGVNSAGASGGLHLSFLLFDLWVFTQAELLGADNNTAKRQNVGAVFTVNLAH